MWSINFFEPLGGLYYARYRPAIPMVAIAHQYVYLHPAYRFPAGHAVKRTATQLFTRLTALGATCKLGLSLHPMPEPAYGFPAEHDETLTILPPLLRSEVFRQTPTRQDTFFLAYLLNSGYADEIIRWHHRHPDQRAALLLGQPQCRPR